jgi:hypothetical protein
VSQENIRTTICRAGWARMSRPASAYVRVVKQQQIERSGLAAMGMSDLVEDHLIPLELGGAPLDARNFWLQPRRPADGWCDRAKDALENRLKKLVCAGDIGLAEAQHAIAEDWIAAYERYEPAPRLQICDGG